MLGEKALQQRNGKGQVQGKGEESRGERNVEMSQETQRASNKRVSLNSTAGRENLTLALQGESRLRHMQETCVHALELNAGESFQWRRTSEKDRDVNWLPGSW